MNKIQSNKQNNKSTDNILKINYKQIYETKEKGIIEWVLIIYDISANHYVGVPIYTEKRDNCVFCQSINKYVDVNSIGDYNRSKMDKCIYIQGKPLKISEEEYIYLLKIIKKSLISFLNEKIKNNIDGISYIKWCRDKFIINLKEYDELELKQNAIYWVNFGIGVGSEMRKLRPAILWRPTGDKKLWTMIPLTTKRRNDNYYFHVDLECLAEGTAKIENMMNLSSKRILTPYFAKDKMAIINKNDYENIKKAISKYYLFEEK